MNLRARVMDLLPPVPGVPDVDDGAADDTEADGVAGVLDEDPGDRLQKGH
jgi:hypothetical protein